MMNALHDRRRFAIYFAPAPDSALSRFGSAWLGRDAFTGATLEPPPLDGLPRDRWRIVTATPASYGFPATLKAPFHLSPQASPDALAASLERFAAARDPFEAPPLELARIANFIALVPRERSAALSAFADACVREFERFRAPPGADELARRRSASLTPHQQALLAEFGYPYVLDEWRFHMTLASGLERTDSDDVRRALAPLAAPFGDAPLVVDAVCLFEQPEPQAPFHARARFPLGGGGRE